MARTFASHAASLALTVNLPREITLGAAGNCQFFLSMQRRPAKSRLPRAHNSLRGWSCLSYLALSRIENTSLAFPYPAWTLSLEDPYHPPGTSSNHFNIASGWDVVTSRTAHLFDPARHDYPHPQLLPQLTIIFFEYTRGILISSTKESFWKRHTARHCQVYWPTA